MRDTSANRPETVSSGRETVPDPRGRIAQIGESAAKASIFPSGGDPLTASLAERVPKLLRRRGLGPETDPEESDPLLRDQPWLAGLYAASINGRVAFGSNAKASALWPVRAVRLFPASACMRVSPCLPGTVSDWNVLCEGSSRMTSRHPEKRFSIVGKVFVLDNPR